ncbi:hypothetical protein MY11210_002991 [Beauveria gryllotalpidicola]
MHYKINAVDLKQSSQDLANSYRWKADVRLLATAPAEDALHEE